MSRVATPPTAKPTTPSTTVPGATVPQEKIAMRAYEKWLQRGCTHGCDMQDWLEAEAELKAQVAEKPSSATKARR